MIKPPKIIFDPLSGTINIQSVLPVIETIQFQALAGKTQLGLANIVFRVANHTRYDHCLGAYAATLARCVHWKQQCLITGEESDALSMYALLHDVGHPAFSHATEDFCPLDDDEMTLELIRHELRSPIITCGVNIDLVEAFADRSNPLYLGVHDRNIGTEKLDYLERDGFYTGMGVPNGIQNLREYVYFVEDSVAIDEKVIDDAADLQTFYMKMYRNVYFRKCLVIAQRMFDKAVYHLILSEELVPEQLYGMIDAELIGLMYTSKDPTVKSLYKAIRERELFREAISIRLDGFSRETRVAQKDICVIEVAREEMDRFMELPIPQKANFAELEVLEQKISEIAKIPKDDVLVVPVFSPERFIPKDIQIYGNNGKLHSLQERRPAHYAKMKEDGEAYLAIRVCAPVKHRKKLSLAGQDVYKLLSERAC